MTDFYKLYNTVKVEPSTSSYGKWLVKISEVTFKFFWHKKDAVKFANTINALEA